MRALLKGILFLLALTLSILSNGQKYFIGFKSGIVKNSLSDNLNSRVYEKNSKKLGLIFAIPIRYNLNSKIDLESGLSYSEKNNGTFRTGIYNGVYNKVLNRYIDLPFKILFDIYKRKAVKFKVYSGGYFSYWLSSEIQGVLPNILDSEIGNENSQGEQLLNLTTYKYNLSFNSVKKRRLEIGGLIGTEALWHIKTRTNLCIDIEYYQSLTSQEYGYLTQKGKRNSGFALTIGLLQAL